MGRLLIKTFITQKDGDLITCQDRIGLNVSSGRFAVADGVSSSYHPEIIAEALCNAFTAENLSHEEWTAFFCEKVHDSVCALWKEKTENYRATLSGRRLKHELYKLQDLPAGASTLAGIAIDLQNKEIGYNIIGDSTLFVVSEAGRVQSFCTSSREDKEGIDYIVYGNHPSCILADYKIVGNWISGIVPLQQGYVALMTDGAAEWFQEAMLTDGQAIEALWNLNSHEEFVRFVRECRLSLQMDDDVAIVLIKVEGDDYSEFEVVHADMLQQLLDSPMSDDMSDQETATVENSEPSQKQVFTDEKAELYTTNVATCIITEPDASSGIQEPSEPDDLVFVSNKAEQSDENPPELTELDEGQPREIKHDEEDDKSIRRSESVTGIPLLDKVFKFFQKTKVKQSYKNTADTKSAIPQNRQDDNSDYLENE